MRFWGLFFLFHFSTSLRVVEFAKLRELSYVDRYHFDSFDCNGIEIPGYQKMYWSKGFICPELFIKFNALQDKIHFLPVFCRNVEILNHQNNQKPQSWSSSLMVEKMVTKGF